MFYNYLKIALRSHLKHRTFTIINTLGLGVGMAACLLILQYVCYEWRYDRVSPHTPHIWRAFNETVANGEVTTQDGNTHSALCPALMTDLPEVTDYFRLYNGNQHEAVFFQENRPVKTPHVWMADPGFLRMFPQRFLEGDAATCLQSPWKAVLTESAARRLLGSAAAVGEMLNIPGGPLAGQYMVEAVVADPPQHTHLKFNVLVSYATRYAKGHTDNWSGYWDYSYFLLAPGADPGKVRRQLADYSEKYLKEEGIRLAMQPFESIHLHSDLTYEIEPNGSARTVRFLLIVAMFVLAIAFVNYVNMTTARSLERAKEVGLRKVVGATRRQLTWQFLLEGLLLNIASLVLALVLAQLALPHFATLLNRPLANSGADPAFGLVVAGLFALGMFATCGYPAALLARFSPLVALGNHAAKPKSEGHFLRKGLIVFQFACATGLMIALAVVWRQLSFMQNHDKGLSLDQIVALKTPAIDWRQDSLNRHRIAVLKNGLAAVGGIRSGTASSVVPGLGISTVSGTSAGLVVADRPADLRPGTVYSVDVEPDFFETYGIRFLAGQPYYAVDRGAANRHVVVNEALLALLGISSPEAALGLEIAYPNNVQHHRMRIVGIVSNFHIESLKEPARPTLYFCQPDVGNGFISLKIKAEQTGEVLAAVGQIWKSTYPESPFEYTFLDEQFGRQYAAEQQLSKVFGLFAGLALFIACLGLYGMAAYLAAHRTKEIGIRKVLGATTAGIVGLLSKDFLKLVLIALVIASPLAYFFMEKWLQDFAYRIDIQWTVFALTGIVAVGVAFLTVSFQSVKAALANPVDSLKNE